MAYQRGDILYTYFSLPNQKEVKNHPLIILSHEDMFHDHDIYIGVMMTHSDILDEHSYVIEEPMFVKSGKKEFMQARLQFVTYLQEKDCSSKPFNSLKDTFVQEIIREVNKILK